MVLPLIPLIGAAFNIARTYKLTTTAAATYAWWKSDDMSEWFNDKSKEIDSKGWTRTFSDTYNSASTEVRETVDGLNEFKTEAHENGGLIGYAKNKVIESAKDAITPEDSADNDFDLSSIAKAIGGGGITAWLLGSDLGWGTKIVMGLAAFGLYNYKDKILDSSIGENLKSGMSGFFNGFGFPDVSDGGTVELPENIDFMTPNTLTQKPRKDNGAYTP